MTKSRRRTVAFIGLIVVSSTAARCITVDDDARVVVNVEGITNTYLVAPDAVQFTNPNDCVIKNPADYLGRGYGQISGGRLVDIQLQTFGTFPGSVVFGTVSVNGVQILTYNGPWSNFATKRSLLTDVELQRQSAGVEELIDAVEDSRPITLCVGGSFTEATPTGLSVRVDVLAQVDATGG